MKVIFLIPAVIGSITAHCHQSLVATYRLLAQLGIDFDEFMLENCPYLPMARNSLIAMGMGDKKATDFFFIDQDVKFPPQAVVEILRRPEGIVAGIYPLKRDQPGFPVEPRLEDGIPIGCGGERNHELIEAINLPTGFMKIRRICIENLMKAYPELQYDDSVVEVQGLKVTGMFDFFHQGIDPERQRWTGEDYSFCKRWRNIGGKLWIYPNIEFGHVGMKIYKGNYHEFLLHCPGGAAGPKIEIRKAWEIKGWMTEQELEWLALEAKKRHRIVELGSHLGRSTRALGDNTPGKVWAIDHWNGTDELQYQDGERAQLFERFRENVGDLIDRGKVVPVRTDHRQSESLPDIQPDMVFIDGDHSYEGCKADILHWKEKLVPGGVLCGHDFEFPEVSKAVTELLPEVRFVPGTNIWQAEI